MTSSWKYYFICPLMTCLYTLTGHQQAWSWPGGIGRSAFTLTVDFYYLSQFNPCPPGQNGRHFADDIFRCIFLNENVWISIKISLNFVAKGSIHYSCIGSDIGLATSHYLNQCWPDLLTQLCGARGKWFLMIRSYASRNKICFFHRNTSAHASFK